MAFSVEGMSKRPYKPKVLTEDQWEMVKPFICGIEHRLNEEEGVSTYREKLALVCRIAWWSYEQGIPLEYEYVFDKDNIYAWAGSVDGQYYPGTTRIAVIYLHWFAKFLIPDYCEEPNLPDLSNRPKVEIYTPEQQAEIMAWARSTKAPQLRQKRELMVSLAFGAGLRSRDLSALRVRDIEIDDFGVLIHSDGRVIPMVEKWTQPIRKFVNEWEGDDLSQWVISPQIKNRLTLPKGQFKDFGGGFEVKCRRMRSTWIGGCTQAYVPESVLLYTSALVTLHHHMHLAPPDYSDPLRMRELFHRNEKRSRGGLRAV